MRNQPVRDDLSCTHQENNKIMVVDFVSYQNLKKKERKEKLIMVVNSSKIPMPKKKKIILHIPDRLYKHVLLVCIINYGTKMK